MKKMDVAFYLLPVLLIAIGTIWGGVAAKRDQNTLETNQKAIKELNELIDRNVKIVKETNRALLKISMKANSLISDINTAQKTLKTSISDAQKTPLLNLTLTEDIKEIQEDLAKTSDLSRVMVKELIDFQTGGSSYLKFGLYAGNGDKIELLLMVIGKSPMRNVRIQIRDINGKFEKGHKIDVVNEDFNDYIVKNEGNDLDLNIEYLTNFHGTTPLPIAIYNSKDYHKDANFKIWVTASNIETVQNIKLENVKEVTMDNFNKNISSSIMEVESLKIIDNEPLVRVSGK